ncbi:DUF4349 domain-containing protein [Streptomyces sp. enrichment culture]|uniref:DUF4349 domain-containing protein n=1 Tax=Streptomyces sp. enrichment culture TaxID=1795815 RepID=UPI003F578A86
MHTRSRTVRSTQSLAGLLLTAAVVLTGCSGGAADSGGDSGAGNKSAQEAGASGAGARDSAGREPGAVAAAPHIIRTASLTVRVRDVPKALDEARAAAGAAGGYVGRETTSRDAEGREHTRVVLRVPSDAYEEVLKDLEGAGTLLERSAQAEDVTEQVVDVESRIRTQRASVARIRALMDEATRLSDVVQLEGELSTRQADLEALLARQASLKDRTSLATITLSLTGTPSERAAEDDDPGFADALSGGWDAFLTTLRWIALVLGAVLPFAAALGLLVLLWLRVVRPRLPRRSAGGSGHAPATTTLGPLPAARAPGRQEEAEQD